MGARKEFSLRGPIPGWLAAMAGNNEGAQKNRTRASGFHDCTLAPEFAESFQELTGLSLGLSTSHIDVVSSACVLCPVAVLHRQAGRKLPEKCGECVHSDWLSGSKNALAGTGFRGPCGCLWAQVRLGARRAVAVHVRGLSGTIARPALRLLKLFIRELQMEFEVASARSALKRATLMIESLQSGRPPCAGATDAPEHLPHASALVAAMKNFAEANRHRPIQLRDVAAELKMNPSYLCALFSRQTGTTFHVYLETLRLTKARQLLRDPTRRVQEIAFETGFCSPAHFCRVFKARIGIPPRTWRESLMAAEPVR